MRKFLIAAALVAVAACGEKAAEAPKDTTAVAPAPAAAMDTSMKMDSTKKDTAKVAPAAAPTTPAPAAPKKP